jgi:lysophospholipase L1-like esterase
MPLKKLLAASAPTLFALLFAGAGFFTCYYLVKKTFSRQIDPVVKVYSADGALEKQEKRQAVAAAYYDPQQALNTLDEISWTGASIPTPFVGNAPEPGQRGNAHINAMQFRAKEEVTLPKPGRTFRIFLTGGSTAYGCGAPSDDTTIAGYLQAILARELTPSTGLKYEVFTMANSAWASTQERIVIENLLSELQPDLVIELAGNNDVWWGAYGRNVLWFRTYNDDLYLALLKSAFEFAGQPPFPENIRIETQPIAPALVAERMLKNVRISAFVLAEQKADLVFVLQPTLALSNKQLTQRELRVSQEPERLAVRDYFRETYPLIANELSALKGDHYQFVDLTGMFDGAVVDEEIFLDTVHFGDRGNEMIAQSIFQSIRNRILARAPL